MSDQVARRLPGWTLVKREFGENPIDTAPATPLWKDQTGQLDLARIGAPAQSRYRLDFADQIRVDVQLAERIIIEQPIRPDVALSTREHFLSDQVLPRLLGHLGHLVLHAGAIRIGEEAILLLGKSGSGKSTLAASFDASGWPLLGDDAVIVSRLNDRHGAAAVYPSLRLFPDSIEELYPAAAPTAAMADYSPKMKSQRPGQGSLRKRRPADPRHLRSWRGWAGGADRDRQEEHRRDLHGADRKQLPAGPHRRGRSAETASRRQRARPPGARF